ncbi:MAG: SMI1/KNR4 family protein [Tannerella sp.]|jgi:hypothetical protein|nr:SMI1/KNR4 family protein [Tannerella sp.]
MKAIILILTSIACIAFLCGCGKGVPIQTESGKTSAYVKKSFSIHYINSQGNIFMHLFPHNPIGADRKTFVALDWNIGKDREWVYYEDRKQKHIDCATFEIAEDGTMRDKNFKYRKVNDYQQFLYRIIENERYENFKAFIEENKYKIKTGGRDDWPDEWIRRVEKRISFKLPDSYIWFMAEYNFIEFDTDARVKFLAYPDHTPARENSILYQQNRTVKGLSSDCLIIMENNEETYYFLRGKNITGNEYKVYRMDNRTETKELYANDFLEFIELQTNQRDRYGRKIE